MDIFSHDFTISDADFHRLVQFIQQNYGIDLSKKRQLISRTSTTPWWAFWWIPYRK